jgi:hypothetical protein
MFITVGGQMVRTFVKDIREAGRNTMGVKLTGENSWIRKRQTPGHRPGDQENSVSGVHCEVRVRGEELQIRDMRSKG